MKSIYVLILIFFVNTVSAQSLQEWQICIKSDIGECMPKLINQWHAKSADQLYKRCNFTYSDTIKKVNKLILDLRQSLIEINYNYNCSQDSFSIDYKKYYIVQDSLMAIINNRKIFIPIYNTLQADTSRILYYTTEYKKLFQNLFSGAGADLNEKYIEKFLPIYLLHPVEAEETALAIIYTNPYLFLSRIRFNKDMTKAEFILHMHGLSTTPIQMRYNGQKWVLFSSIDKIKKVMESDCERKYHK